MKIRAALIGVALIVSGCTSSSLDRSTPGLMALAGTPQSSGGATNVLAALHGGLIGGTISAKLNDADKRQALEAEYRALEYTRSGEAVTWQNSGSGHSGEVVAAQPYRVGSQDCRQYTHTVTVGGGTQSARGTACRNSDGSWTPLT